MFFSYNDYLRININQISDQNSFWMSLFYLNNSFNNLLLIGSVVVVHTFISIKHVINLILIIILFVYTQQYSNYNVFLFESSLNKDLYNGLLIIHPIMTYISGVLFYNLIKNEYKIIAINRLKYDTIKIFSITLLATLLGSLWAQQELNWGGWWNWDAVEIILLCVLTNISIYLHIFSKKKIEFIFRTNYHNKILYVMVFYFVVRSNFVNSVHSFSVSVQIQRYFYLVFLLITLMLIYSYYFSYEKNKSKIKLTTGEFLKKIDTYVVFMFTSFFILVVTILNMSFFFFNIKMGTNSYKYLSILIKLLIFYFFLYRCGVNAFNISLIIVVVVMGCDVIKSFLLIFFLHINKLLFSSYNERKLKLLHNIVIVILYLLLEPYDVVDNYNISANGVDVFSSFLIFNNSKIFSSSYENALASEYLYFYNIFIKSLNDLHNLEDIINIGSENSFFNSNILNYFNKIIIGYSIDGSVFMKVDLVLTLVLSLLVVLMVVFFSICFFEKKFLKMV